VKGDKGRGTGVMETSKYRKGQTERGILAGGHSFDREKARLRRCLARHGSGASGKRGESVRKQTMVPTFLRGVPYLLMGAELEATFHPV